MPGSAGHWQARLGAAILSHTIQILKALGHACEDKTLIQQAEMMAMSPDAVAGFLKASPAQMTDSLRRKMEVSALGEKGCTWPLSSIKQRLNRRCDWHPFRHPSVIAASE